MKVLLVDAFDSFVYVVAQYFGELNCQTEVRRTDDLEVPEVEEIQPDLMVLGPGPGSPSESLHPALVHNYAGKIPILGICLGHQAIGEAFGAKVCRARAPRHGETSAIGHDGRGVFADCASRMQVTRYHSLVLADPLEAPDLVVTARALDDGHVMGVRHRRLPIESVQFHPESILTDSGLTIVRNAIRNASRNQATGQANRSAA